MTRDEERKTEGKTTPLAKGTILEPGAFLVLEETKNFDFGFGKVDTQFCMMLLARKLTAMPILA